MLHIHLSNRPEALAVTLAEWLRAAPLPLLEKEIVVVPSTAAARWLAFRLADTLGASAQVATPFAAAFVWQLFGRVLPEVAAHNPFDRMAMQWRLLRLAANSNAAEVRHYLANDDGSRSHDLAVRLAALFDRYLVERPDWLLAWGAGRRIGLGADEGWQADLWRALVSELAGVAAEHPGERFLAVLKTSATARSRLPRRISLFAVEAMPTLYWEVFAGLAEWIELRVFVLSPSREYWGDIERVRARLRLEIEQPAAAALIDHGQPLLASLGRARQSALVRLADTAAQVASDETACFVTPPASLLGRLQHDLLDLTTSIDCPADQSIQVHACHGPLREAEVLHDRLLALFEVLPDLTPADILILTPDIETYGPLVAAVLQHAAPPRRIPCTVADRPLGQAPLWRAMRRLCAVAAGEVDAESTMSLLDEPALRRAFGIVADDLPLLRDWVAEAGIRWAEDGAARARRGLPADASHTWRAGLRRLLLGVALSDTSDRLHEGILPIPCIEGSRAALLGRLIDFAETVFDLSRKVGAGRTATAWSELLLTVLERSFAPEESEAGEAQHLREILDALAVQARGADCTIPLPLSAVLREVDAALVDCAPAQAFGSGTATIAALQPGRPLPARVVCVVGLNDGDWPRPVQPPAFDLLARYPRAGDRNRRAEERYALLEALLCARDALLITHTGNDPRSNVALPPAAPLAEVLDTLAAMTGRPDAELVTHHPLQPFSPAYFTGSATLFSFDAEHCPPTSIRTAEPFIAADARAAGAPADVVELEQWQRFFAHPTRFYLREQLGIHLEAGEELLESHEPFVLNRLEAYRLRAACFEGWRAGRASEQTQQLLRARGWLPQGAAGDRAFLVALDEALPIWHAARPWAEANARPACETVFSDGLTTLSGRLDDLTARGLWRLRFGRLRAPDRLRLWLDHLLLQAAGQPMNSILIALDGTVSLAPLPVARAGEILADLLAIHRDGLLHPIPFYPETAWAWLEQKSTWRSAWTGSPFQRRPSECEDPYRRLALRDCPDDPLGESFQTLARRIFQPLRDQLEPGKVGDG